jgi:hypothetical protein
VNRPSTRCPLGLRTGRGPNYWMVTLAVPPMPIAFAAARLRSIQWPLTNGPRSVMRMDTLRPLPWFVGDVAAEAPSAVRGHQRRRPSGALIAVPPSWSDRTDSHGAH